MSASSSAKPDLFLRRPHRVLLGLALPTFVGLALEPLAGVVDTAFVASLGAESEAALGAATMLLSGTFWVFNFLAVGTQTEVGEALGHEDEQAVADRSYLALMLALGLGFAVLVLGRSLAPLGMDAMGARDAVAERAMSYVTIRLWGAPALLCTFALFGACRGMMDMRTPMWVAFVSSFSNVLLDWWLIFGVGPFPALGLRGAAWASTWSHWIGFILVFVVFVRRVGGPRAWPWKRVLHLLGLGRDLILRTAALMFFLLVATRVATQAGAETGAAHQMLRQTWLLSAFCLDSVASASQSLVAYFRGSPGPEAVRRVVRVALTWGSVLAFVLMCFLAIGGRTLASPLLPPLLPESVWWAAWWMMIASQPFNAIAFVTDGLHLGAGHFRYLRNGMWLATSVTVGALLLWQPSSVPTLEYIWAVAAVWVFLRALWGMLPLWLEVGPATFRRALGARQ